MRSCRHPRAATTPSDGAARPQRARGARRRRVGRPGRSGHGHLARPPQRRLGARGQLPCRPERLARARQPRRDEALRSNMYRAFASCGEGVSRSSYPEARPSSAWRAGRPRTSGPPSTTSRAARAARAVARPGAPTWSGRAARSCRRFRLLRDRLAVLFGVWSSRGVVAVVFRGPSGPESVERI